MESTPDAYAAAFREIDGAFRALAGPLSPAQFNWKPGPDRWSVGQCMDHLNGIAARYLPQLEALVARGGPAGEPPFRYGRRGRLFIAGTGTGAKKAKTLRAMEPAQSDLDRDAVVDTFHANTERFLGVIERARGLDLAGIRTRSPFMPPLPFLTFELGAVLEATAGHERRHLDQARRVTEAPGFPAA